jgi:hypothetical protein
MLSCKSASQDAAVPAEFCCCIGCDNWDEAETTNGDIECFALGQFIGVCGGGRGRYVRDEGLVPFWIARKVEDLMVISLCR